MENDNSSIPLDCIILLKFVCYLNSAMFTVSYSKNLHISGGENLEILYIFHTGVRFCRLKCIKMGT